MQYTELNIRLKEVPFVDILVAWLNEIESYAEDENGLKAYVQTRLLNTGIVKEIISKISELTEYSYRKSKVKKENCNAKWESNFPPVIINDNCVILAHFHKPILDVKYEIIITPKMSFGTEHHETTSLIMNEMFCLDFKGKSVLDIGSGTGVLAILASKLGAINLVGIDFDKWAFENAKENATLNNISNIDFIYGVSNTIGNEKFDVILVNINRNIILQDINKYLEAMYDHSEIILSGFLIDDVSLILDKTEQLGLELVVIKNKNKWQMLHLRRP